MAPSIEDATDSAVNDQHNDQIPRILTRLARIAAIVFAIGFLALLILAFVFSEHGPATRYDMILIGITVAVVFISGTACLCLVFSRELVAWKRNRWRFSVGQLISWMTLIAVGLAIARFHFLME